MVESPEYRHVPTGRLAILAQRPGRVFAAPATWDESPTLVADAGVENVNSGVDGLIETGLLRRVLALREVTFPNSLIEAWWRTLKHQWLFLNTLDSISAVRRLVDFYVTAHNSEIPHSAFQGQTPDEMYSGRGHGIAEHLEEAKKRARAARLQANRASSCGACWHPAPMSDKTLAVA